MIAHALAACAVLAASAGERDLWRAGGRVVATGGRAFDYTVNFFRYPLAGGTTAVVPAEATIVDESHERATSERRVDRAVVRRSDDCRVRSIGDWRFERSAGVAGLDRFTLTLRVGSIGLHLHGTANKGPVDYDFGYGTHRLYTSISSHGELLDGDVRSSVSGKSWLEAATTDEAVAPEGDFFEDFIVQFDDGTEAVIEGAGYAAGRSTRAILVPRRGVVCILGKDRYSFIESGEHRSTIASAEYPTTFDLEVYGRTGDLTLEPFVLDSDSRGRGAGPWMDEGAFAVRDAGGSAGSRLGTAYGLYLGFGRSEETP